MQPEQLVDRHLLVIFGGTGDLARRKLLPSVYRVITENGVADRTHLMAVSRSEMDDDGYRLWAREALAEHGIEGPEVDAWCLRMHFHGLTPGAPDLNHVAARIADIEAHHDLPGNRAFYLALPPTVFPTVIDQLGNAGLNKGPGWTRLVIEKPFGRDLESAIALNEIVHRHFDESQVYRIDHYLGKETVQNLLTFRFANLIFESTWSRDRVASVEITVAEELGIERRAGYYEQAGVLRDMVQNHLTQLMTLIAMEAPSSFTANAIRNEKVQVLESIKPIDAASVIFGQYGAGTVGTEAVPAYLDEEGVDPHSTTPTFVALKLAIENWRWQGVPFFLRTGKRLPKRSSEIAITYQSPPVCIFHGVRDDCPIEPNVIVLTLQPHEGFAVRFEVKSPGENDDLETRTLHFDYHEAFEKKPDAYQTLLIDIIEGDQTLFVRADEVEASWRLYGPLLDGDFPVHSYAAGTWGPSEMDATLALGTNEWTMRKAPSHPTQ